MDNKQYVIVTNLDEMDFEVIYDFICQSYWAKGMPRALMQKALVNSLCFAVLDEDKNTLAFARMITDKATFAYLSDVFVVEAYRGMGLSKRLLTSIIGHPDL